MEFFRKKILETLETRLPGKIVKVGKIKVLFRIEATPGAAYNMIKSVHVNGLGTFRLYLTFIPHSPYDIDRAYSFFTSEVAKEFLGLVDACVKTHQAGMETYVIEQKVEDRNSAQYKTANSLHLILLARSFGLDVMTDFVYQDKKLTEKPKPEDDAPALPLQATTSKDRKVH